MTSVNLDDVFCDYSFGKWGLQIFVKVATDLQLTPDLAVCPICHVRFGICYHRVETWYNMVV